MISKVALLNPNCLVCFFNFNFISWLVYYPFVCALFVINWIKWTCWSLMVSTFLSRCGYNLKLSVEVV